MISLMRGGRVSNHGWGPDTYTSHFIVSRATLVLIEWSIDSLSLIVAGMIVSAVSINHALSCLPTNSTHFIWLILNNAWGVWKILHWMPLEGVGWMLQRWDVSVCIKLRIALTWVKMRIGWLMTYWGWYLVIIWWCNWLSMIWVCV